jgi:hypothetical protein
MHAPSSHKRLFKGTSLFYTPLNLTAMLVFSHMVQILATRSHQEGSGGPPFLSPKGPSSAMQGRQTQAVDIFSLGCVFYTVRGLNETRHFALWEWNRGMAHG